jgi:hypothetical protein
MITPVAPTVDLARYCARVNYSGALEPTLHADRHHLNVDELEATLRKDFGLISQPDWRLMLERVVKPKY